MTYATMQSILSEVNDVIGFELYAVKFSGKGRCLILYEGNKLIARGSYAVASEIIVLHNAFCGKGL